jgi:GlpG protein
MRNVGTLGAEVDARRFADYLLTLDIEAKAEPSAGSWAIWIVDERHVDRGKRELHEFLTNPADPRYKAAEQAAALRRAAAARKREVQRNVVDLRSRWQSQGPGSQRLTMWLVIACVVVSIFTDFGDNVGKELHREHLIKHQLELSQQFGEAAYLKELPEQTNGLAASLLISSDLDFIDQSVWQRPDFGLEQIAHGEPWRLVTPIFVHFRIGFLPLHLIFNMIAFMALASAVEYRQGRARLALLILATAVFSNLMQYFWTGNPFFGGMSGVVFALFGYVWLQSRYAPLSGLYMDSRTVFMYLFWFVLCFTGQVGPIANMAHAAGLALGAAFGFLIAKAQR